MSGDESRPRCIDDPSRPCHNDLGSHGPREIHDHPVSGDPINLDAINHNHVTRDVKALGDCPACDRYHADARAMPPGEDRTAGEYLSWSVSHWRGRARIAEAEVERLRAEVETWQQLAAEWEDIARKGWE